MDHAGAVLGPVLSVMTLSLLLRYSSAASMLTVLRWTFAFSLIPGLAAVAVLVLFVREKQSGGAGRQADAGLSLRGLDRNFLRCMLVLFVFTLGNSSDAFLLFRVKEVIEASGLTTRLASRFKLAVFILNRFEDPQLRHQAMDVLILPLVWAFFHAVKVLVSTPLAALSDRIGRKSVICVGWGIYTAVYVGFSAAADGLRTVRRLFPVFRGYRRHREGLHHRLGSSPAPGFRLRGVPRSDRPGGASSQYSLRRGLQRSRNERRTGGVSLRSRAGFHRHDPADLPGKGGGFPGNETGQESRPFHGLGLQVPCHAVVRFIPAELL
jgi:hypothetical protein